MLAPTQVMDDYDSDIEELSQSSFNEQFETRDDLSPIESAPVVDVFVNTTTKGKVRRNPLWTRTIHLDRWPSRLLLDHCRKGLTPDRQ
jgi:hypothetical protein